MCGIRDAENIVCFVVLSSYVVLRFAKSALVGGSESYSNRDVCALVNVSTCVICGGGRMGFGDVGICKVSTHYGGGLWDVVCR